MNIKTQMKTLKAMQNFIEIYANFIDEKEEKL